MAIKIVYVSKLGKNHKISEHFTLKEFQCKDGSDLVKYSTELLNKLEELREYLGGDNNNVTITLVSAYRTPTHNKRSNGATNSQHLYGTAADICVKINGSIVNTKKLCCLCQTLKFKGVGYIGSSTIHVDMRSSGNYRGDERKGYDGNVNNDFYSYFGFTNAQIAQMKYKKQSVKQEELEMEELTQAEFNKMMDKYLADRTDDSAASWSAKDREWAERLGIVKGSGNNMGYKELVTKEQVVAMLSRFADEIVTALK